MGRILSTYLCPHPPIIMKEIGKGKEKEIQKTIDSFKEITKEIKELKPNTIIVITPHGPMFRDAVALGYDDVLAGDMSKFNFYDFKIEKKNNKELVERIINKANIKNLVTVKLDNINSDIYNINKELDHGVLVPLYFIDKEYKDYNLVHITYGLLSNTELYEFGTIIQEVIEENSDNCIIIASGDLSHKLANDGPYDYSPSGIKFDSLLIKYLKDYDVEKIFNIDKTLIKEAGECGYNSVNIMLGTLDGYKVKSEVLSYEGPFGVGYAVVSFNLLNKDDNFKMLNKLHKNSEERMKEIREKEDEYVKLARNALETYIRKGILIKPEQQLSRELLNKEAGVFVSIKKDGELRGCIGTIAPTTKSIANEIIENAIKSGTEDPRFFPVEEDELNSLVYSVDVLGEPEKVNSIHELDEKRYGVIVSCKGKRGLLLPNLEGVNSVNEQIEIALSKAGINNENYDIERFEVIRHY